GRRPGPRAWLRRATTQRESFSSSGAQWLLYSGAKPSGVSGAQGWKYLLAVHPDHLLVVRPHVGHVDLVETSLDIRLERLDVAFGIGPGDNRRGGHLRGHQGRSLLEVGRRGQHLTQLSGQP